jgi:hypothetical protein
MMSLSEQDRGWVKAMITEAVGQAVNRLTAYTHEIVEKHEVDCRPMMRVKAALWGVAVGAGLGGTGLGILVSNPLKENT